MVLPNFWILVGLKSPTYHAVGLMPPGLPILGLGRNDDIAWSGTNMHAAASELYDVSGAAAQSVAGRQERIRTRFWFDSEVTIRRAPLGPIISDVPFFPGRPDETVALHWTGHEASDEIGAFLGVMRARSAGEFRQALAGYAVGGQNMLCVTRTGDICQVMAVHLPVREPAPPADLVRRAEDPAAAWHGEADALALPWALNPADGRLASATSAAQIPNGHTSGFAAISQQQAAAFLASDLPALANPATAVGYYVNVHSTAFPAGYFFPTSERVERLYALLSAKEKLSLEDLALLQQDTLSLSALTLKTALIAIIGQVGAAEASSPFVRTLESWDGRYEADQRGPVAFEALMHELAQRLYGSADGKVPSSATDWNYLVRYLPQDLSARPEPDRRTLIKAALDAAAAASARYGTWGDIHRVRVGHALAGVPVVGRFFVLDHYAVGGSRNTIMKTAHGLVNGRHDVTFGSQSRQLCDMSDPDRSEFVLLGWLGSANFADQVELWRQGRTITMPLTAATVAAQFPTVTRLTPGSRR